MITSRGESAVFLADGGAWKRAFIRTPDFDLPLVEIPSDEMTGIHQKPAMRNLLGFPTTFSRDGNGYLTLWPVPDATYEIVTGEN